MENDPHQLETIRQSPDLGVGAKNKHFWPGSDVTLFMFDSFGLTDRMPCDTFGPPCMALANFVGIPFAHVERLTFRQFQTVEMILGKQAPIRLVFELFVEPTEIRDVGIDLRVCEQ
jgi:hypothetical protein